MKTTVCQKNKNGVAEGVRGLKINYSLIEQFCNTVRRDIYELGYGMDGL